MSDYENETCEGCVHYEQNEGEFVCMCSGTPPRPSPGDRCEHFVPSLKCRQVRALERLAKMVSDDGIATVATGY
jgi:hypothetical protein